ncbi:MAG: hypothetical protein PVI21_00365 [Candidatus Woesebacteria bacterium]|jgi:hypothetical protein
MSKLLALVVDDLRTLIFPEEYEVIHARTVEHAAVALATRHVDVLVLDHDLGTDTVKRLITFIQMRATVGPKLNIGMFYIVSSNPQAHTEFPAALQSCGYTMGSGIGPAVIDPLSTALWSNIAREVHEANNPYEK